MNHDKINTLSYKNKELIHKTNLLGYNTITTKFVPDTCSIKSGLEYESVHRASERIEEALGYLPFTINPKVDEMESILEEYLYHHKDLIVSSLLLKRLSKRNSIEKPYLFHRRLHEFDQKDFVVHKSDVERLYKIERLLSCNKTEKSLIIGVETRNGHVEFLACDSLIGNVFLLLKDVNVVFIELYRLNNFVSEVVSTKYVVPALSTDIRIYEEDDFVEKLRKIRVNNKKFVA